MKKVKGKSDGKRKGFEFFCRTMSKHMAPQKNKVNINTSVGTPQHIVILSSGIDDSYTLSKLTMSVILEKTITQKKALPEIRKVSKMDHGKTYYDHRGFDTHPK